MRFYQKDPPRLRNWKCRQVYHVYQRGSQRQNTFHRPEHLLLYLDRLDVLARRYKVRIHAFCLMSNHVHFMFEPQRRGAVSRLMQHLQSYHARYMNGLNGTEGHLWRNHFHAKHIASPEQYRRTLLYIEQNATQVRGVKEAHLYPYSSAAAHVSGKELLVLRHKHFTASVRLYLGRWRKEFAVDAETNWAAWLRKTRSPAFLDEVAQWTGKPPQPAVALPGIAVKARGS